MPITASMLYDYIQCPHRVWRDVHGPQSERNPESNPFVELLWDRGVQHEAEVLKSMGDLLDLSDGSYADRFTKTVAAMQAGVPLIYQGVLMHADLLGIPDLLKRLPDGQYVPLDVKSGMALEGSTSDEEGDEEEGKPKPHYVVQLCLYVEVLRRLGFATQNRAIVIDIHHKHVEYDLDSPRGKRTPQTWWDFYQEVKEEVTALLRNSKQNKPAMSSACKMCPWYASCKAWCKNQDDPTCLSGVGRSKRDILFQDLQITSMEDLVRVDIQDLLQRKKKDKKFLHGMAEKTLGVIVRRATIMKVIKQPVAYRPIVFPSVSNELYFDIEDDPTREFVYLHGVYQRSPSGERFYPFVAQGDGDQAEEQAWREFWQYIQALPQDDYAVYYYS